MSTTVDFCVTSLHKEGGAVQGTSVLLWNNEGIEVELVRAASDQLASTSPSFPLLASAGEAVRGLASQCGEDQLGRCIRRARELRVRLRSALPALRFIDDPGREAAMRTVEYDPLKLTLGFHAYRSSGFEVQRALNERGIVVEKAGLATVTLLVTLQLPDRAEETLTDALLEILAGRERVDEPAPQLPTNPFAALDDAPFVSPRAATDAMFSRADRVHLDEAAGRVACQRVEVYPPGIPILLPGFIVRPDAVRYLLTAIDLGANIATTGTWTGEVAVLPRDLAAQLRRAP
jgi:arginine decarboxylase